MPGLQSSLLEKQINPTWNGLEVVLPVSDGCREEREKKRERTLHDLKFYPKLFTEPLRVGLNNWLGPASALQVR